MARAREARRSLPAGAEGGARAASALPRRARGLHDVLARTQGLLGRRAAPRRRRRSRATSPSRTRTSTTRRGSSRRIFRISRSRPFTFRTAERTSPPSSRSSRLSNVARPRRGRKIGSSSSAATSTSRSRTATSTRRSERRAPSDSARTSARSSGRFSRRGSWTSGRALDPENDSLFTWWAPWRQLKERNIGWRLDYVLASETLASEAVAARVYREFGTSDHGPVLVEFG